MRNPWCEMFQAYAPASPNATRSPARSRLTRTRRASTSLGVHSCPAIVTACPVTPGRGHDWERAIFKRLGAVPLADQLAGLRALGRKNRELDLDRVGIFGWSFGGYLSALAVMKEPGVFRAAVAGAPPSDWLDYDTHYTERYLGMPDTDATAYREASLLTWAAGLKRPLLLIHGTGDDNVYFRHTLKLVDAFFRAGKEFDLLPLSGLTHSVPDPVVNEQLYSRIVLHFKKNLGTPRP